MGGAEHSHVLEGGSKARARAACARARRWSERERTPALRARERTSNLNSGFASLPMKSAYDFWAAASSSASTLPAYAAKSIAAGGPEKVLARLACSPYRA